MPSRHSETRRAISRTIREDRKLQHPIANQKEECHTATCIILSRFSPDAFRDPKEFSNLANAVSEKIKQDCPNITWKESFATPARFDVIDIVDTDQQEEIDKAAMIIRGYGHSTTETLQCAPWKEFLEKH